MPVLVTTESSQPKPTSQSSQAKQATSTLTSSQAMKTDTLESSPATPTLESSQADQATSTLQSGPAMHTTTLQSNQADQATSTLQSSPAMHTPTLESSHATCALQQVQAEGAESQVVVKLEPLQYEPEPCQRTFFLLAAVSGKRSGETSAERVSCALQPAKKARRQQAGLPDNADVLDVTPNVKVEIVPPVQFPASPRPQDQINTAPNTVTPNFVSRETELEELNTAAQSQDRSHRINVAVTGPPGVGKTQLVLKFIEENKDIFHHVLWISSEVKKSTKNSFTLIGKQLQVQEASNAKIDFQILSQNVYKALSSFKTLFVFDNAFGDIQKFLPPVGIAHDNVFVVVTSQYTEWPCNLHLSLQCFSAEVSGQFLESSLGACEEGERQELAELLGHLPLALQTAVCYIKHQREMRQFDKCNTYTTEDFILEVKLSPEKFSSFNSPHYDGKPLSGLCDSALQAISQFKHGDLAVKLLKMMAWMEPDNIDGSIFDDLPTIIGKNIMKNKALQLLKNHSLISNCGNNIFIPSWLQIIIKSYSVLKSDTVFDELLVCLNAKLCMKDNFPYLEDSIRPHVRKVLEFAIKHDDLVEKICLLSIAAARSGDWETQLSAIEKQKPTMKKLLARGSEDLLKFNCFHVSLLLQCEQYEKVIAASDEIVSRLTVDCGLGNHPHTLFALYYKASALFSLGRLGEAWTVCEDVHKRQRQSLVSSTDSLGLMCKIACKRDEQGKHEQLQFCILFLERTFNQGSSTEVNYVWKKEAEIISDVAERCISGGKVRQALELYLRLHGYLVAKFDQTHNFVHFAVIGRANCLVKLGENKVAWRILKKAVESKDGYCDIDLVTAMCKTACTLDKEERIIAMKTCAAILLKIAAERFCYNSTLKNIQYVKAHLHEAGMDQEVLQLYSTLYNTLVSRSGEQKKIALRVLLHKAFYVCKYIDVEEAWQIYETVRVLCKQESHQKPGNREDMLALFCVLDKVLIMM